MSLQKLQYVKNSLNQAIKEMDKYPQIQSRLITVERSVHHEMLRAMAKNRQELGK